MLTVNSKQFYDKASDILLKKGIILERIGLQPTLEYTYLLKGTVL